MRMFPKIFLVICFLLFCLFSGGASAQDTASIKNVLVLHELGELEGWGDEFDSSFYATISKNSDISVAVNYDFVRVGGIPGEIFPQNVTHPADLVVAILPLANQFLLDHGDELFPGVPKVFALPGGTIVNNVNQLPDAVIFETSATMSLRNTVSSIFSILPDTRRLVVVGGISVTDYAYLSRAQKVIDSHDMSENVIVEYLVGLPVGKLLEKAANLPWDSAILFVSYEQDMNNNMLKSIDIVSLLSEKANVPVFGFFDTLLGRGIVGGNLTSAKFYGKKAAEIALQILQGTPLPDISAKEQFTADLYDWRQLKRWGILEESLPQDSLIHYKTETFWEVYKTHTIIAIAVMCLQAIFIFALCLTLKRARNVEKNLREIQARLKAEELFTEAVINSLPGIFYVYDENEKLIRWNKNHEVITGYSDDELVKKSRLDFFVEADKEKINVAVKEVLRKGEVHVEARIVRKDGSTVPCLFTGRSLELNGKQYLIGLGIDISERIKLGEQLQQAQKMEAIGTLAGGIAHDFNNILSALFGYTELAQMQAGGNPKLSRNLDEVLQAAGRARDLVMQILTFSRKSEHEKKPLQMDRIVKEALKLLRSSIPTTINIKKNINSPGLVLADPTQIHQIVMNLCTNSYHAISKTGGTLGVSLQEVNISSDDSVLGVDLAPGKYLQLGVSDTGCGMEKETRDKIFEPYYTTKEAGEGTGLGLAVVHGIVQSHNGRIAVYSEPGQGTTFHVYLPVVEAAESEGSFEIVSEMPVRGNERIMFVDDEEKLVHLAEDIFTKYGYRISTFSNSVQALESFVAQPDGYDLLITDMTMPSMTGEELTQKVLEIRPDFPVILCTGFSETINRQKALSDGFREFLQKPLVMSSLLQVTRKVLDTPFSR